MSAKQPQSRADTTRNSGVATVLLAGGKGSRLHDLTATEAKPAVHFAGRNRIIDFAMANTARSGLDRLIVATQFAPATLHDHLPARWGQHFTAGDMVLRDGRDRYLGTADAVRHNWDRIADWGSDLVLVLAADHIYDMDYGPLIAAHRASGAAVTVAVDVVPVAQASGFGVMQTDAGGRILSFLEKPAHPPAILGEPDKAMVSMGVYVFEAAWLRDALLGQDSRMDFGHEVIPMAVAQGLAAAYRLAPGPSGDTYWRDVGTLDALRRAHLDFLSRQPARLPRISTLSEWYLGRDSVAMPGALVPASARLTRCLVAPGTRVPAGLVAGEDAEEDGLWFRRDRDTILITQAMLDRRDALRVQVAVPSAIRQQDVA
ncbi:sugar phosphate nucleotidyltransferase [uncultured Paracoccus sp.]|uniref:sugar phosphate nucleotidyltransferase n=1 Tax=uncultured Paracoccus sp. TaxID=189685 RepID=UPI0025E12A8C|nr:sugar phosphate nucleotidyltransferase [uncultured Paracoccus sp.]